MKIFWDRLRPLLAERHITQKAASDACGVKFDTFRSWIFRNLLPDCVSLFKLANLVGVSMEYLLTGREGPTDQRLKEIRYHVKQVQKELDAIMRK